MINCIFEFDLESGKVSAGMWGHYAVRYRNTENGVIVEIGDGYRHEMHLEAKHWNRILRIIRDDELDKSGVDAILRGLLARCLHEEHIPILVSAIKAGTIKEIKQE